MLVFATRLLWLSLGTDLCWALLFGPLHLRPRDAADLSASHKLPAALRTVYLAANAPALALTAIEAVLKLSLLALAPPLRVRLKRLPAHLRPELYAHWKPGAASAAAWLSGLARAALVGAMLNSIIR